jgi:serine/threonine-protein kinase RsbW
MAGGGAGESSGGGGGSGGARQFSWDISSDFLEARPIQEQIIAEVVSRQYSDNDLFAIKLALEEALINAIKHGNRLDLSKRVRVQASVSNDLVDITIRDQGAGFKREDVPDPTLTENLEKNCGRGILLIEAYMTTANWTDSGRCLHMTKVREASLVTGSAAGGQSA